MSDVEVREEGRVSEIRRAEREEMIRAELDSVVAFFPQVRVAGVKVHDSVGITFPGGVFFGDNGGDTSEGRVDRNHFEKLDVGLGDFGGGADGLEAETSGNAEEDALFLAVVDGQQKLGEVFFFEGAEGPGHGQVLVESFDEGFELGGEVGDGRGHQHEAPSNVF